MEPKLCSGVEGGRMSMLGDGAGVVLEISVLSSQLCSKTCNLFKKKKRKGKIESKGKGKEEVGRRGQKKVN